MANLKLKNTERVDSDEGKDEVTRKTAQAKLLDLLDRAKKHCAVVGRCGPAIDVFRIFVVCRSVLHITCNVRPLGLRTV